MIRRPSLGLLAVTLGSVVAFFGLAGWGWGGVSGLVDDPARAAGLGVIGLAALASLFSGIHLGGCARPDAHGRWRLVPLAILSLGLAALPPWLDRRGVATFDPFGLARPIGLALLVVGAVFRVGPMFVLGDRFTWPLASQPGRPMQASGFFRWVRHPSYAGALVGAVGWALLCRSFVGLGLVALLVPSFLPVVWSEEDGLLREYGEAYAEYRRKTWRLIPGIY